jgi:hypothetical protein
MLGYFAFYLVFCLFNTSLLNLSNVLLLVLPVALILRRNAALAELTATSDSSRVGFDLDRHVPADTATP